MTSCWTRTRFAGSCCGNAMSKRCQHRTDRAHRALRRDAAPAATRLRWRLVFWFVPRRVGVIDGSLSGWPDRPRRCGAGCAGSTHGRVRCGRRSPCCWVTRTRSRGRPVRSSRTRSRRSLQRRAGVHVVAVVGGGRGHCGPASGSGHDGGVDQHEPALVSKIVGGEASARSYLSAVSRRHTLSQADNQASSEQRRRAERARRVGLCVSAAHWCVSWLSGSIPGRSGSRCGCRGRRSTAGCAEWSADPEAANHLWDLALPVEERALR